MMRSPLDVVAKASRPRSMPVACPVVGSGCTGMSAHEKQTYQPSASWLIATVLGVPSMGRDQRTAMRPIDAPNLGEHQKAVIQRGAVVELRIGEAVVAVTPLEA